MSLLILLTLVLDKAQEKVIDAKIAFKILMTNYSQMPFALRPKKLEK